jgi:predicted hydrocarbon binding protein
VTLEVRHSVTVDTAPKSAGCAFYEAILAELMRQFVGAVGMVDHVRCASRQEGTCEWRAEWSKVRR